MGEVRDNAHNEPPFAPAPEQKPEAPPLVTTPPETAETKADEQEESEDDGEEGYF